MVCGYPPTPNEQEKAHDPFPADSLLRFPVAAPTTSCETISEFQISKSDITLLGDLSWNHIAGHPGGLYGRLRIPRKLAAVIPK